MIAEQVDAIGRFVRFGRGGSGVRCRVQKRLRRGSLVRRLTAFLALALSAVLLLPALASASFSLSGTTSQGQPIHFLASQNLMKIVHFKITWSAQCVSGTSYTSTSSVAPMRVNPFPRFGSRHSHTTTSATYSGAQGRSLRFRVSAIVTGRLELNGKASGTWSAQVRVLGPARQQIDTCKSGAVTWKAELG
jgi:hypothetical protein